MSLDASKRPLQVHARNSRKMSAACLVVGLLVLPISSLAEKQPTALEILRESHPQSPREVFETFWKAMNLRRELVQRKESDTAAISTAVSCLDTSLLPPVAKAEEARQAAIFLKEIIDRIAVPEFSKMPDATQAAEINRWSWLGTRIVISRQTREDGTVVFLFSAETVRDALQMFEQVRHLPYVKGGGQGAGTLQFQMRWAWANQVYLGLAIWQWIGVFVAILLGLSLRLAVQQLMRILFGAAEKSHLKLDYRVVKSLEWPLSLALATGFWFFCIKFLQLTGVPLSVTLTVIKVTFYLSLVWAGVAVTSALGRLATERASHKDGLDQHLVRLLSQTATIFVLIIGVLFAAQGLGFNVFSLVAGLGIGGLAVAMAAKDTLANFFGSVAIMLDKPFKVGQWVRVGGCEGIVEDIGFRSTRLRTFDDSLVSVPNSNIVTGQVDNMGARKYRRINTTLGITYDTPPEKIEEFLQGIKNILMQSPAVRPDNFQVAFFDFGASSLNILLVFYLSSQTRSEELKERQTIFMQIIRLANTLGITFAFPTQTIHIETTPEHPVPRRIVPHRKEV